MVFQNINKISPSLIFSNKIVETKFALKAEI